jgi:2-C-methyl-D-erythritol 4-phosphate cytidylyltransferase
MIKHALIVAGGYGKRMKLKTPKQFIVLNDKPLLMHTISAFYLEDNKTIITVVLPDEYISYWNDLCKKYHFNIKHNIVKGGAERFFSVKNGLDSINETNALVAIHDGVRALISTHLINKLYIHAEKYGNAVPAIPVNDSVRQLINDKYTNIDRTKLKLIQTPQCFHADLIKKAYNQNFSKSFFTDDATVLETLNIKINLIEGEEENIKITTPKDLIFAQSILPILQKKEIKNSK